MTKTPEDDCSTCQACQAMDAFEDFCFAFQTWVFAGGRDRLEQCAELIPLFADMTTKFDALHEGEPEAVEFEVIGNA